MWNRFRRNFNVLRGIEKRPRIKLKKLGIMRLGKTIVKSHSVIPLKAACTVGFFGHMFSAASQAHGFIYLFYKTRMTFCSRESFVSMKPSLPVQNPGRDSMRYFTVGETSALGIL